MKEIKKLKVSPSVALRPSIAVNVRLVCCCRKKCATATWKKARTATTRISGRTPKTTTKRSKSDGAFDKISKVLTDHASRLAF